MQKQYPAGTRLEIKDLGFNMIFASGLEIVLKSKGFQAGQISHYN